IAEVGRQPLIVNLPYPLERSNEYHPSFVGDFSVPTALRRPAHAVFEQVHMQSNWMPMRKLRRKLGLSGAVPNAFARMRQQQTPHELLVSPVLFPRPTDWPDYCRVVGMPGSSGESEVTPDLDRWLSEGDKPVFFGFGSMSVPDPAALMELIAAVANRLGVRALVGAGWTELPLGANSDRTIFVARSIDYARVLPRCTAAVHHGGSGTTHDVARAGIPAVLTSVGGDQPLWGGRIEDLGIGVTFPFRNMTADRLHDALRTVTADRYQERATTIGHAMAEEDGTVQISDTVERLMGEICV
ncbi:glycosyltransferase, partial [Rhodococcus erythropolis]